MRRAWLIPAVACAVAAACDDFDAGDRPRPETSDAGVDSGAPVLDAGADAPVDAGTDSVAPVVDAGPCATCRSGLCDPDGGCYPLAFVTSKSYTGNLEPFDAGTLIGAARGDAICNQLGNPPDKPRGEFVAWVSTAMEDALTRLTNHSGVNLSRPVVLSDGTRLVDDYTKLATNDLRPPINRTELGGILGGSELVWTGTSANGSPSGYSCASWASSAAESGSVGYPPQSAAVAGAWTLYTHQPCGNANHLYCFEVVK